MAGNGQKREQRRIDRVVPGVEAGRSSRVSKAAGSIGSNRGHVEQRSSSSASRSRSKSGGRTNGRSAAGVKPKARKPQVFTPDVPADSQVIGRLRDGWSDLPPHQQKSVISTICLIFSLVLFLTLTLWHSSSVFGPMADFFFGMFSWSSIPLTLGLIVIFGALLIEGIRDVRFIRWSLVLGLLVMLILLLVESQLIGQMRMGGIIGGVLAFLLSQSMGSVVAHILTIGLLLIVTLLTFRVTLSQFLAVLNWFRQVFMALGNQPSRSSGPQVSPYLGQRPSFSRYANGLSDKTSRKRRQIEDEEDEDEAFIKIEDNFDAEEDDPRNDINLHKQQVGKAPKGLRLPEPSSREESQKAVKGARQLPLPVPRPAKQADSDEMLPLAPNPLRVQSPSPPAQSEPRPQLKVTRRGAKPELSSVWKQPDTSLLNNPADSKLQMLGEDTTTLAKTIQDTLRSFRVEAEVRPEDISIGPTVIRFGIRPTGTPMMKEDEKGRLVPVKDSAGNIIYEKRTRVSRIMALQNDLALVLESKTIRMEAPVPCRPYVGVEIPNKNSRLVTLREILESKEYQMAKAKSKLTVALGKDVAGAVRVGDLAKMPHLLIAGATGAGKSVMINTIIASIITQATPDDVRMLMVDPKMVELSMYNGIPHLLSPVVTEVEKVVGLLKIAIAEMEKRYRLFSQLGVRNLDGYRRLRAEKIGQGDETLKNLPAIVIIIDELADLMMAAPDEVEGLICRLAQLARATGIHLVVATQRPSVDVITGLIKANIPTRISFMVSSAVDSRTIIDMGGAERLLGRGDMLYLPADAGKPERIQGAFVADEEAERLMLYWREQAAEHAAQNAVNQEGIIPGVEPGWEVSEQASNEFGLEDDLLEQAEQIVQEYERASASLLQRRLKIGYSRAARLIDLLEERGIISKAEPNGRAREVLESRSARSRGGEGRSMADEAAEIIEEEKQRTEFLKKQAERESGKKN
jgi:DNA segregation ATPase FtsK/SpoIIIE-like protein